MSKRVKQIAGCTTKQGERIGLRRVEDRSGPNLLSAHLELYLGEDVLATDQPDIEATLNQMDLDAKNKKWLLGHLHEAVRQ